MASEGLTLCNDPTRTNVSDSVSPLHRILVLLTAHMWLHYKTGTFLSVSVLLFAFFFTADCSASYSVLLLLLACFLTCSSPNCNSGSICALNSATYKNGCGSWYNRGVADLCIDVLLFYVLYIGLQLSKVFGCSSPLPTVTQCHSIIEVNEWIISTVALLVTEH